MIRPSDPLRLKVGDIHQEDAQTLLAALTEELVLRYGDDGGVHAFHPEDMNHPGSVFLLAYWERQAVGCGALRPLKEAIGEIKRMYVAPGFRGMGIARQIVLKLERMARELGYLRVWLETGTEQPEAIQLYESCGYHQIPVYGYYKNDPRSRCFEKNL